FFSSWRGGEDGASPRDSTGFSVLRGSMREPPFARTAVCGSMERSSPGAQTKRRGEAGPVRLLLGGGPSPAILPFSFSYLIPPDDGFQRTAPRPRSSPCCPNRPRRASGHSG